ncbi:RHS repeat-associated core domain-containing protein [Pseudomonas sp. RIT-PI-q]|uniref:RHS repeat-associated core domain-containing protein n=1 Tax=Pseudomonas sp. RIT-PI-q TaxID=1690247 RepID=UPI0009EB659D|nr:RHS repeat-associated core domain-containing protein [Pseudomonas sp. RIT-PI-q]
MTQAKTVDQENMRRQRTVLLAVDLKNSVLTELDASNPNRMAYSPYGHQSAQRGVMTRLGFNGELLEVKPEWYLLGNGYRAYNPRLKRFHSPDRLSPFGEGGLNAYGYCEGEPVMNSDPTGQSIWALSRAVISLTNKMGAVATQVVSKTINAVNRGVSQVVGAAQRAKQAFADNFLFDPDVLKKLGPPPPKVTPKPRTDLVFRDNRYSNAYNSKHISRQPTGQGTVRPTSSAQGLSSSRTTSGNQPGAFRQPLYETHSELLNMNGNPIATIRTGR